MKEIIVENLEKSIRIDKYIASELEMSRTLVELHFENELVLVNNVPVKKKYKVKNNDNIVVNELVVEEESFEANGDVEFEIIFENEDYAIVNKPRGLVVHPAPGHYNDTLVNGLVAKIKDLSTINGQNRPGIVHRIDKDTSGILVIAKNDNSHKLISEQLSSNKPKREYYAIVEGLVSNNSGTIVAPIGRSDIDRKKYTVTAKNSKKAVTHFEVIERYDDKTLVKCILETGRTHQIRVHMNYISHPIVGDDMYNKKTKPNQIWNKGQALHAKTLAFIDPKTNEEVSFDSNLDDYMNNIITFLKEGN